MRSVMRDRLLLVAMVAAVIPGFAQSNANLQTYFRQSIGLSQHEITSIQSGTPITKPLPSRTPSEVFLFGAVYIHAAPGQYLRFSRDFNRLRKLPDYLALEVFGTPPKLSDLKGFSFEDDDVQALRDCALADCQIQLPEMSIEELHRSVDWTAADANQQANQFLQKSELRHLMAYQREGDLALGVYDDKRDPAEVAQDFASLLSYDTVLPGRLPEFYHYILVYPNDKPANVEDLFYWEKVKFGLKPTLRVVQVLTRRPWRRYCLCHRRETALLEPLLRDLAGLHVLCPWRRWPKSPRLLSDHGHGLQASRSEWLSRIDRSRCSGRPIGLVAATHAHDH